MISLAESRITRTVLLVLGLLNKPLLDLLGLEGVVNCLFVNLYICRFNSRLSRAVQLRHSRSIPTTDPSDTLRLFDLVPYIHKGNARHLSEFLPNHPYDPFTSLPITP